MSSIKYYKTTSNIAVLCVKRNTPNKLAIRYYPVPLSCQSVRLWQSLY